MNKLKHLQELIEHESNDKRAFKYLEKIYSTDRFANYDAFGKTASNVANLLNNIGLEATIHNYPADGLSSFGDWIMPIAWKVKSASINLISPHKTKLVDYKEAPNIVNMWSGKTPKKGLQAEVVHIKSISQITKARVGGKIIITPLSAREIKKVAHNSAALTLLHYSTNPEIPEEAVEWQNGFSERRDGWAMIKGDLDYPAFSISAKHAKLILDLIKKRSKVVLNCKADTVHYNGELPVITGLIKGKTDEEVLISAHLFEQGADDNASGGAAMLEAAATLASLIKKGKITKPTRSIRFLFTNEIYGTVAYAAENIESLTKTVAGANMDIVGGNTEKTGKILGIYRNPHSNVSFTHALMKEILKSDGKTPDFVWESRNFLLGDTLLADPMIGVPIAYLGTVNRTWHTNADNLSVIDPIVLGRSARCGATYLYYLATAGKSEALELAELIFDNAIKEVLNELRSRGELGASYIMKLNLKRMDSVLTLCSSKEQISLKKELSKLKKKYSANCSTLFKEIDYIGKPKTKEEKEASKLIPVRLKFALASFDSLSDADKEKHGLTRWSKAMLFSFFYCDGKKSLYEIVRLTSLELGNDMKKLYKTLPFLATKGYLKFRTKR